MKFTSASLMALAALAVSSCSTTSAFVPSSLGAQRGATSFGISKLSKKPAVGLAPSYLQSTATATKEGTETFEFNTNVGRVMDLIINSLYSDRDIFLREVVSNAADACDKKRYLSSSSSSSSSEGTDKDAATTPPLEIKIRADVENNCLIVEDSGVGMTRDELINNLGKIAQSGTRAFSEALGEGNSKDVSLIGQFGVGFYSAYLVASKVTVLTKSLQDPTKAYRWESEADSSYTISEASPDEVTADSGTKLILHMREDASDYLDSSKLEELVKRYSEFVEYPVGIWKETTEYKKVPDENASKDLKEGEEPPMKTVPETTASYETVNKQKPLWLRTPADVTDAEYAEFYKSAFPGTYDEPMKHKHFFLEGQVECKALLYLPSVLPFELSREMFSENNKNVRLYVKRVFINDKFEDLLPRWLSFIKGVVDSDDLPLNVSREILQKSRILSIINKRLVRKSLDMIRELSEDEDKKKYINFWNNFGKYLKVGAIEDDRNRNEIASYLRFYTTQSQDELLSLDKYVDSMKPGQKDIYYVTGEGKSQAAMSPVIEKLKSRGYDVLLATDPLDEILLENLRTYRFKNIVDAAKDDLDLDPEGDAVSKRKKERLNREYVDVTTYLETILSDRVQKVSVSDLLTDSPAVLVKGAYGLSPTMQRFMKVQAVAAGEDSPQMDFRTKACMEINPNHPIVKEMERLVKKDKEGKNAESFGRLLYDVAAMISGYEIGDMPGFASRVIGLMSQSKASSATTQPPSTSETK